MFRGGRGRLRLAGESADALCCFSEPHFRIPSELPTVRRADPSGCQAGDSVGCLDSLVVNLFLIYVWVRPFRRTNPPPRGGTQESVAALSFGMVPATRRTNRGPT